MANGSDREDAVARAKRDEAEGNLTHARHRLKSYLVVKFDDIEARRFLAALYRRQGYPDEAGRWGYLVPGGSTERERQAYEHACAHRLSPMWTSTYIRKGLGWRGPVDEAPEPIRAVLQHLDLARGQERGAWQRRCSPIRTRLKNFLLRR